MELVVLGVAGHSAPAVLRHVLVAVAHCRYLQLGFRADTFSVLVFALRFS